MFRALGLGGFVPLECRGGETLGCAVKVLQA